MRRVVMMFVLCAAAFGAGPAALPQGGATFRGTADNVPVFVTVTDSSGRLVPGLTRTDFEVRDNGKPQPLTVFDSSPQPVRLIVMIDVSGSMAGNLPILRAACMQLIAHLGKDDLARIGTFGKDITISPTFTRDAVALTSMLPTSIPPDSPTPLWDGVDQAIGDFGTSEGRRVVLVLSDGKDSGFMLHHKFLTQIDISDRAEREDVMVYGVGLQSRGTRAMPGAGANLASMLASDLPDPGLGTVALETGGGYIEIRPSEDLGAAFARVADELHQQYLLGFDPPASDGKVHKIDVRMTNKDLKPRARKTYRAPKQG
jgi:Ca-activated chloride channel family protein